MGGREGEGGERLLGTSFFDEILFFSKLDMRIARKASPFCEKTVYFYNKQWHKSKLVSYNCFESCILALNNPLGQVDR